MSLSKILTRSNQAKHYFSLGSSFLFITSDGLWMNSLVMESCKLKQYKHVMTMTVYFSFVDFVIKVSRLRGIID